MANIKGKTEAEKAYQRELKRIQQIIRRAEKQGVVFSENIIPRTPKTITEASINRLKKITPKTVYKMGKGVAQIKEQPKRETGTKQDVKIRHRSEVQTADDYVRHPRTRKPEDVTKEERNRKAREKRARDKAQGKTVQTKKQNADKEFEKQRREQDKIERKRLVEDDEYRKTFENGNITKARLNQMLDDIESINPHASQWLRKQIELELKDFTEEQILKSLSQVPSDMIETVDKAMRKYEFGAPPLMTVMTELLMMIRGTVISAQEMREMEDEAEKSMYEDGLQ